MDPIDLFHEDIGSGSPILLVHGYPLNHEIWKQVALILREKARVIMPDLRGMGKSPATPGAYSMHLLAEDLLCLMDLMRIDKTILAGHSMGGYVCLEFARVFPDRVSGIALVASQAVPDSPDRRQARYVSIRDVERNGIGPVVEAMLPKLTDRQDLKEVLTNIMSDSSKLGVMGCLGGMAERQDAREWIPDIKIPALVIAGKNDKIISMDNAKEMAALFTDGKLEILQASGHMPMMEQPEETAKALLSFLGRVKQVKKPAR